MATKVPILLYHSISEQVAADFSTWALSPGMFSEHLRYLQEQAYTPLTVSQFVMRLDDPDGRLPSKPVVITFDDGLDEFYENAFPILNQYGFNATLYITSGSVGNTSQWLAKEGEGDRPMLSWEKIREIDHYGIECGSHTLTHPQLDVVGYEDAYQEIFQSKQMLEDKLGKTVESFAYPHGYHNGQVRQLVIEAGYSSACAVRHAMSSTVDDRFALARIIVKSITDVEYLTRFLEGDVLQVAPFPEKLSTKAWRLYRRSVAMVETSQTN